MQKVIIRHSPVIEDSECVRLRDKLEQLVSETLDVKPHEVEIQILTYGMYDKNVPMLSIEVHTGTGKRCVRFKQRKELGLKLEEGLRGELSLIPESWRGGVGSYIWLWIGGSSFIPVGFPELAR